MFGRSTSGGLREDFSSLKRKRKVDPDSNFDRSKERQGKMYDPSKEYTGMKSSGRNTPFRVRFKKWNSKKST